MYKMGWTYHQLLGTSVKISYQGYKGPGTGKCLYHHNIISETCLKIHRPHKEVRCSYSYTARMLCFHEWVLNTKMVLNWIRKQNWKRRKQRVTVFIMLREEYLVKPKTLGTTISHPSPLSHHWQNLCQHHRTIKQRSFKDGLQLCFWKRMLGMWAIYWLSLSKNRQDKSQRQERGMGLLEVGVGPWRETPQHPRNPQRSTHSLWHTVSPQHQYNVWDSQVDFVMF